MTGFHKMWEPVVFFATQVVFSFTGVLQYIFWNDIQFGTSIYFANEFILIFTKLMRRTIFSL